MTTGTLRNWGGAIAVSLPKKILALLGLKAGAEIQIEIENGRIVLSPAKQAFSIQQLETEQSELVRKFGRCKIDHEWLEDAPRGRELL